MEDKNKTYIMISILAVMILFAAGSSFAYFSTTAASNEGAVNVGTAIFKIGLEEDISLIKSNIIPSIEEYVDIASQRRGADGNFLKPSIDTLTNEEITDGTVCIDDNLREICSIYTFTVYNEMDSAIELNFYLKQVVNTFENLYIKVIDDNNNEIVPATKIMDNRYEIDASGNYLKDSEGKWIKKANFDSLEIAPVELTQLHQTLAGTTDPNNRSEKTYSIVMWVMEIHRDQTIEDSGKGFASTLTVIGGGQDGNGITGVFSLAGNE